ncbi:MAG: hypothetical protein ACO1OB_34735 [Archangium sp.]
MASKKEERAFMRGETGVDGQATEEVQDEAAVEQSKAQEALLRGRTWLGRECLTWLLWKSESTEPVVNFDGKPVVVVFNGKLLLRAGAGDVTEASVKGVTAPYSKLVKQALQRGLLVHVAKLQLTCDEQVFDLTVDAEFFDLKSVKLPALLQEEEDDKLTERLELVTRASGMMDTIVAAFIKERSSKSWASKTVPALKEWMNDL